MGDHVDELASLDGDLPLDGKLAVVHGAVRRRWPFVGRISVVSFEPETRRLRAFSASPAGALLGGYSAPLDASSSLAALMATRRSRVVDDLGAYAPASTPHTRALLDAGITSSYTLPMSLDGAFWGFLFFNSTERAAFREDVLDGIDPFAHLLSSLVTAELVTMRLLVSALRVAHEMVRFRDPEAGGHLERVAHLSALLAEELTATGRYRIPLAELEAHVILAPLGGPESTRPIVAEATVKSRRAYGLISATLERLFQDAYRGTGVLRRIAEFHHEAVHGVPVHREEPSLAARIVAVAQSLDALTGPSRLRLEEALGAISRLAADDVDRDCLEVLRRNPSRVLEILARYRRTFSGLE